ncbi:MAG: DUF523 domain-containing protein [Clostridia bacterium]|nr:DUF523 domain-containing protein [Clostridia bacterium]
MRILISGCLLGCSCRYDGGTKPCLEAIALKEKHQLIPVCPEQLGGLTTPRTPCEHVGGRVMSIEGQDRTDAYTRGALEALKLFDLFECDCAVLKARSPMCGSNIIYDGTFSGHFTEGDGVLARMLKERGVKVYTEDEIACLTEGIRHREQTL